MRGCAVGHNYSFEDLALEEPEVQSPELLLNESRKSACLAESGKFQNVLFLPNTTSRFVGRLLGWGKFARFAEPWMRTLPPEQLLFVKTEDLEGDNGPQLVSEILRWAGLRDLPLKVRRSNTAACRGSHARGAFTAAQAKKIESGGCEGPGQWGGGGQKTVQSAVAAQLHEHMREHNARFAELTGMDVASWDNSKFLA